MVENVVIIGGGPAGLAAAIYNARASLTPVLFSGSPYGGQLMLTSDVENYPGFESILGPELIEKMRNQAKKFGTRMLDQNVVKVDFSKRPFEIYLPNNEARHRVFSSASPPKGGSPKPLTQKQVSSLLFSKSVIIATGAKALWLGLENETRLRGKGVSACATCDGFFFKDKIVAVVGGGDSAMEEALFLTKFAKKVTIIHRKDAFRASKIMQDRVLSNPKIEVIWNSEVIDVLGKEKVEGVKLKSTKSQTPNSKQIGILPIDGLFIAIGHKPDTDLFKGQIELDKKGYIITNKQSMTSVEGVFAAGDCVDYVYRQAGTAVGMGIAAALEVEKWLEANKDE